MKNLDFLVSLHSIDGFGSGRIGKLLNVFGDPKVVWEAKISEMRGLGIPENILTNFDKKRKEISPPEYLQEILDKGIKILTIFDADYPSTLKEISDSPIILYYRGEIKKSDSKAIGVVGTRKMTGYGRSVTEKFTRELVEAGVTIVSGLARGVDTQAHKSALEAGGRTLAILGGGLDIIFPQDNVRLAEDIWEGRGAVISEFPPSYPSLSGNFPARNRIISGLSKGVLVTEAAEDSGSLITARLAIEQGREVFAVPGPITSNLSEGPLSLIKTGAKLVTSVSDILEELGIENTQGKVDLETIRLSEIEAKILESLNKESRHIDELCRELSQSSATISSNLIKMEITGLVKSLGSGVYVASLK